MKEIWEWGKRNWVIFTPHWVNFTPLIIFIIYISLHIGTQSLLFSCDNPKYKNNLDLRCSVDYFQKYVLAREDLKVDAKGKLQPIITKVKGRDGNEESSDITYQVTSDRYGRQVVWLFFIAVNIFVCFIALVVFISLARKSVELRYILVCLFISLSIGAYSGYGDPSPIIEPVINKTIEPTNEKGEIIIEKKPIRNLDVIPVIQFVNFVSETLAVATAFILCAILFRSKPIENSKRQSPPPRTVSPTIVLLSKPVKNFKEQETLLEQVDHLRIVLYVATLLLIVGILRMSAVLNWSLSFLPQNSVDAASSFFATFTFVISSSYTILLASIYLPAYYILKQKAVELVRTGAAADDKLLESFKSEFFTFSIKDSLPRIVAIIAPFLTGTLTEQFLKTFTD